MQILVYILVFATVSLWAKNVHSEEFDLSSILEDIKIDAFDTFTEQQYRKQVQKQQRIRRNSPMAVLEGNFPLSPTQAPTSEDQFSFPPTMAPTTDAEFSFPPTMAPTTEDELSFAPTFRPTFVPSAVPTTDPTEQPTETPTVSPTEEPTVSPTTFPSYIPTAVPSDAPTASPSTFPTYTPTIAPTETPSVSPSVSPTHIPSATPSESPSVSPSVSPTFTRTRSPSRAPSFAPTRVPTATNPPNATPFPTVEPATVVVDCASPISGVSADTFNSDPKNGETVGLAVDTTLNLTPGTTAVGTAYDATTPSVLTRRHSPSKATKKVSSDQTKSTVPEKKDQIVLDFVFSFHPERTTHDNDDGDTGVTLMDVVLDRPVERVSRRLQTVSCVVPYTIVVNSYSDLGFASPTEAVSFLTSSLQNATTSGVLTQTITTLAQLSTNATDLFSVNVTGVVMNATVTYNPVVPIPTDDGVSRDNRDATLSHGDIAGIVIGGVIFLGLCVSASLYVCYRYDLQTMTDKHVLQPNPFVDPNEAAYRDWYMTADNAAPEGSLYFSGQNRLQQLQNKAHADDTDNVRDTSPSPMNSSNNAMVVLGDSVLIGSDSTNSNYTHQSSSSARPQHPAHTLGSSSGNDSPTNSNSMYVNPLNRQRRGTSGRSASMTQSDIEAQTNGHNPQTQHRGRPTNHRNPEQWQVVHSDGYETRI